MGYLSARVEFIIVMSFVKIFYLMSDIHKYYLFISIAYSFYEKHVKAANFFNLNGGKGCEQFYNGKISVLPLIVCYICNSTFLLLMQMMNCIR